MKTVINNILKRLIDIVGSLSALIIFSPLFIWLVLMVKRDSEGPVLYKQVRVGRGGNHFKALKFRTMTVVDDDDDGITSAEKTAKRVTKSGYFFRKYRLDELPQFWNILVGDMSLVGPRPQIPKYIPVYPDTYKRILSVRPGMTGLATVKFHETEERMLVSAGAKAEHIYTYKILPRKFHYNLFYIRNHNICFDIKILWWTAVKIIGKS
jgi:lipopolysaccharide/colanic/teichoic acid biosynthesis glycosyltransferase